MAAAAVGGGEQSTPEFWPEGSGILPMDERPPPPALRLPRGRRDVGLSGWLRSRCSSYAVYDDINIVLHMTAVHDEEESLVNLVHPFSCVFSTDEKGISHSSRAKNPTSSCCRLRFMVAGHSQCRGDMDQD
uniref:Uncharacterized protein n=1 Tax=Oryza rufipogon TaxID=4529 RepID=A0A0E0MSM1_ORYRU